LLDDDATMPLMLIAIRGQRAFEHQELKQTIARKSVVVAVSVRGVLAPIAGPIEVKQAHAWWIRYLTKLIEIVKLPPEQQESALQQFSPLSPNERPPIAEYIIELPDRAVESLQSVAEVRCAAVGLAVERYRRAQGHWPETLADLVPAYLPQTPLDPFTGKELGFHRLDDGVAVYSVGPCGAWKGGYVRFPVGVPGADKGFRLWDVDKRRQSAPPVPLNPADSRDKPK
jgi:hypothetical protein